MDSHAREWINANFREPTFTGRDTRGLCQLVVPPIFVVSARYSTRCRDLVVSTRKGMHRLDLVVRTGPAPLARPATPAGGAVVCVRHIAVKSAGPSHQKIYAVAMIPKFAQSHRLLRFLPLIV